MDRREALRLLLASAAASASSLALAPFSFADELKGDFYGWTPNTASLRDFIRRNRYAFISQQNEEIKGTGVGKIVQLHKALEVVMGTKFVPHHQQAPDCVAHAYALGSDILKAVQIVSGRPEKWVTKAATEPIYGGSRVNVGNYRGPGGGSTGHWAAEWVSLYGILLRQQYPGYDFTTYDPVLTEAYGRTGCPEPLIPFARLHPIKKVAICKNYSELRDCVANGSPIIVCSNVGFGSNHCVRDSDGFLTRQRRPWYHAMLFAGYDDVYRRKGALCINSWGTGWISGPTRGDQPQGSFWVDASTVDAMLSQGDSFAVSGFVGFPRFIIPPYILR